MYYIEYDVSDHHVLLDYGQGEAEPLRTVRFMLSETGEWQLALWSVTKEVDVPDFDSFRASLRVPPEGPFSLSYDDFRVYTGDAIEEFLGSLPKNASVVKAEF